MQFIAGFGFKVELGIVRSHGAKSAQRKLPPLYELRQLNAFFFPHLESHFYYGNFNRKKKKLNAASKLLSIHLIS